MEQFSRFNHTINVNNYVAKTLNNDVIRKIISLYTKYKKVGLVALECQCHPMTIRRILRKNKIFPQTRKQYLKKISYVKSYKQEQTIINLFKKYNTILPIRKKLKCGENTIKKILIKHGFKILNKKEYIEFAAGVPKKYQDKIIHLYRDKKWKVSRIRKKFNLKSENIFIFLRKNKITKHSSPTKIRPILLQNKDKVYEIYNKRHLLIDVARFFKTSVTNIESFLVSQNKIECLTPDIPKKQKITELTKLYQTKKLSYKQLGKIYNCSASSIGELFRRYNIKRRTKLEGLTLISKDPNTAKNRISSISRAKPYVLPSNRVINIRGYEPQFLDYVFGNKKLGENDFDFNIKQIGYVFKNKNRNYYPDFYIPKLNLIVEIKSSWTIKLQSRYLLNLKKRACINRGYNYLIIINNNFKPFDEFYEKQASKV